MPVYRVEDSETGLVLNLEGDSPPTEAELVDIFSQYKTGDETAVAPEEEDSSFVDQALDVASYTAGLPRQMIRSYGSGFLGQGVLGTASGLSQLADTVTDWAGFEDLIDSGQENEVIRVADAGKEWLDKELGVSDEYKDSWLVNLGGALGQMSSMFLPSTGVVKSLDVLGAAPKVAGWIGTGVAAVQGAGLGAEEGRQRIDYLRSIGVEIDDDAAEQGILIHSAIGLSEALPFKRLLDRIAKVRPKDVSEKDFLKFKNNTEEKLKSALKQGTVEGVQEVVAGIAHEATELGIYNQADDRPLIDTETMWDDFTLGGAAGAILDAVTRGHINRRGSLTKDIEQEREAQLRALEEKGAARYQELVNAARNEAEQKQQEQALAGEQRDIELADIQREAVLAGSAAVDPAAIPYESEADVASGNVRRSDAMGNYADQIASNVTRSGIDAFPSSGIFSVTETESTDSQGNPEVLFSVEHVESGQQYGQSFREREDAIHLMSNLNGKIRTKNVDRSVLDSIHLSPETYTDDQAQSLFVLGQRIADPKHNTITSSALNHAAGTVDSPKSKYNEGATLDSLQIEQFTVPPIRSGKRKYYQPLQNLTAAQQINLNRVNNGLPEVDTFSLAEARDVLGDRFPELFDVLSVAQASDPSSLAQRKEFAFDKDARDLINKALNSKNISSALDSREVKQIFKTFTGESNIKDMSSAQRRYIHSKILEFPVFNRPTRLPNFFIRPYTREQFASVTSAVQSSGDGTVENIIEALGPMNTEKQARSVAGVMQRELKEQGVISEDNTIPAFEALPAPQAEPTVEVPESNPNEPPEDLSVLRRNLNKVMKGFGLEDVGLSLDAGLKPGLASREGDIIPIDDPILEGKVREGMKGVKGYYIGPINRIFLELDKIDPRGSETTPEVREAAMTDALNHEIVHAVRRMDLWTDKEWLSLENLAKKKTREGNVTYHQDAQETYRGLPGYTPVRVMEEAVANLIRDGRRDPKIITGKPKGMVNRLHEFFERMRSALRGTGFQSFGDIMQSLESGEVGARERGQIRTLRATEDVQQAVPERGIGRERDIPEPPREEAEVVDDAQVEEAVDREPPRVSLQVQSEIDNIINRNEDGSIRRAIDEAVTRPALEENAEDRNPVPFTFQHETYSAGDVLLFSAADKLLGLKQVEAAINKERTRLGLAPILSTESVYEGEESIAGKTGNDIREFQFNRQDPLAKKIADAQNSIGVTVDEVDDFLVLRHAIERNASIAKRNKRFDSEDAPGAGRLKSGEVLTDSFVKDRMKNIYGMDWNDASGTWSGGNDRGKAMQSIAADTDQIIKEANQKLVDSGLVSKEDAEKVVGFYKYYAPLRGKSMENDVASVIMGAGGLSMRGGEYMRAKGRESAAESPLGHIMIMAERAISRGNKNTEFGQRLVNLIKDHPNSEFWDVYSPDNPRYREGFDRNYTYIGADPALQGQTAKNISDKPDKHNWVQKVSPNKNLGVAQDRELLVVKDKGKPLYVDIKGDPRLRNAMLSLDADSASKIIQHLGIVNRWLSMMNTSFNPGFVVGNFSRDIQTAIGNLLGEQDMTTGKAYREKLIGKVLKDTPHSMGVFYRGLRRYNPKDGTFKTLLGLSAKDAADFKEFAEAGAKADWFHSRTAEEQAKTINDLIQMQSGTFRGNFKRGYTSVLDFVEDTNSAVENAVRLATFKAGRDAFLEAGIDRKEAVAKAASLAKNLTINFNRKGMHGDTLNAMYLFFNASVQGTMNFARGLFGPRGNPFSKEASRVKQGAAGGLIALGALLAMKAEEESEEDPDTGRSYYSQIESHIKERNMIVMREDGIQYYTVPLPYGYNLFYNIGSHIYEVTAGIKSPATSASELTSALLGSFSPVPLGQGFSGLMPTAGVPVMELDRNENFFGAPIYRENLPMDSAVQYPLSSLPKRSTSPIFESAATFLNSFTGGNKYEPGFFDFPPDALEHLFKFATGGAGAFALRSTKAVENWAKGEDVELRETPFLRLLMRDSTGFTNQSEFYDRKERLKQKDAARKGLRGKERVDFIEKNRDYFPMVRSLKFIDKQLNKVDARLKQVRAMAATSPKNAIEAARMEKELYEVKDQLYGKFNKLYDKRVGRLK